MLCTILKTECVGGAGYLALRTRNGRLKELFVPGGTPSLLPKFVDEGLFSSLHIDPTILFYNYTKNT